MHRPLTAGGGSTNTHEGPSFFSLQHFFWAESKNLHEFFVKKKIDSNDQMKISFVFIKSFPFIFFPTIVGVITGFSRAHSHQREFVILLRSPVNISLFILAILLFYFSASRQRPLCQVPFLPTPINPFLSITWFFYAMEILIVKTNKLSLP